MSEPSEFIKAAVKDAAKDLAPFGAAFRQFQVAAVSDLERIGGRIIQDREVRARAATTPAPVSRQTETTEG